MKKIESVSIWDNGQTQTATVLNAYAVNVSFNTSATFYYSLMSETAEGNVCNQLAQGNLTMSGDVYSEWNADNFAWDWIAEQLNLVITGDYVAPVIPEPIQEKHTVIEEILSEVVADEVVAIEEVIHSEDI
jgi:hypothetical protein